MSSVPRTTAPPPSSALQPPLCQRYCCRSSTINIAASPSMVLQQYPLLSLAPQSPLRQANGTSVPRLHKHNLDVIDIISMSIPAASPGSSALAAKHHGSAAQPPRHRPHTSAALLFRVQPPYHHQHLDRPLSSAYLEALHQHGTLGYQSYHALHVGIGSII